MKTTPNNPNGWQAYIDTIKSLIKRDLSTKEYSKCMNCYINRKSAEEAVEELK